MNAATAAQLAAAVAAMEAEIAARLVARRRLLELARLVAVTTAPTPPPLISWEFIRRANVRLVRPGLIH